MYVCMYVSTYVCMYVFLYSTVSRLDTLYIYNTLIKFCLLCGAETWRLKENNRRWVEAIELDVLRRSYRISSKDRIMNVTIRQPIGLEESIIK